MARFSVSLDILQLMKIFIIIFVWLIMVLTGASGGDFPTDPVRDAYHKVKTKLLSHPYAVNKIPPKVNFTDSIDITIGFTPQQVLFVNEVEMTVTVSASLMISWHDPAFAWDPTNHSVYAVSVSTGDVWTPTLINSLTIDSEEIIQMPPALGVFHNGMIITVQKVTITVSCPFDMEWYPFDEQTCLFPILPYNSEGANVNTLAFQGQRVSTRPGNDDNRGDWTLKKVTPLVTRTELEISTDLIKNVTYVSFEVLMKRRGTAFYITNVIFPVGATAILTVGVFLIPAASGEKISYLISNFISSTVFLSSLSNTMSKGQGNICRFNAFIVAVTVNNILATAASIFVLHRYNQEQEQEQTKEEEMTPLHLVKDRIDDGGSSKYLRRKMSSVGDETNLSDKIKPRCTTNRAATSFPKPNAFEKTEPTHTTSGDECVDVKRQRVSVTSSGLSRYWSKGYRLTSTELDRMFLVLFAVVAIISSVAIMHGQ